MDAESLFRDLYERLATEGEDVVMGKMMSSPGMKYAGKVFAFFNKGSMGFRLGPEFDPQEYGLKGAEPLSPFKTKAPLKGWYVVGDQESETWEDLTRHALRFTKGLK